MPSFRIDSREPHAKGLVYQIAVAKKKISVIITRHAGERLGLWECTEDQTLETLLFPEEVLIGHRDRFIAHRKYGEHVLRVIYEYEDHHPVIVTVYFPYAKRYFEGGGRYADRVFS